MKSTAAVLLLLTLAPPLLSAQDAPGFELQRKWENDQRWEEQIDIEGRFNIYTPALLEQAVDTVATPLGKQAYHTYFFEVPDARKSDNVIYMLSYVDYPRGALHQDSTELVTEFLEATEAAAAEAVKGEVIYSDTLRVGPYPARRWRIDYRDGEASARSLAIVAHHRYYEVKTFSLKARGTNKSTDKFFNSLEIYPPDPKRTP